MVSPPFYKLTSPTGHHNAPPLGLSYIAASLKRQGHTVALYCTDYAASSEYPSQDEMFDSLDYYKRAHTEHPVWDEIREAIRDYKPDCLCISMLTPQWKSAQLVATIAKQQNPQIRTIIGGVHPTLNPTDVAQLPQFDTLVIGSGEGLDLSTSKKITELPKLDINSLPHPLQDSFVNGTEYLDRGHVITSRGCYSRCSFCVAPQLCNGKVQFRDTEDIIEEIREIKALGVETLRFDDDNFIMDVDRTVCLLQRMREERLDLPWTCDARIDRLTEGLADLMSLSNCIRVKLGIESGSDKVLRDIRKGITVEQIRKAVTILHDANLPFTAYLLTGLPTETNEDLELTLELAKWMEADYYSVSVFTPYYGTAIYKELEEQGRLPKIDHWEHFFHQSQQMLVNDKVSPKNIQKLLALNDKGRGRL